MRNKVTSKIFRSTFPRSVTKNSSRRRDVADEQIVLGERLADFWAAADTQSQPLQTA